MIFLICFLGCASSSTTERPSFNLKGNSKTTPLSSRSIDNGDTYEVFFTSPENIDTMTIKIDALYFPHPFAKKKVPLKSFFIVEKALNISMFQIPGKDTEYVEIGRNFNKSWGRKNALTIKNRKSNLFHRLEKNSRYRIRFTVFKNTAFSYKIRIYSESKIVFSQAQ